MDRRLSAWTSDYQISIMSMGYLSALIHSKLNQQLNINKKAINHM
jgi:hypothetical protein